MSSDQGNKRASDDGDDVDHHSDMKRQRLEDLQTEIRILIASRNAGAVIGKGGEVIKKLREDYRCTVSLPDSQGPERILNITGKASSICDILREMIPKFDRERDVAQEEIRMLINQNLAGRIIGKQGVKVKELKELSGAQIKVYMECCPESTERVVQLMGEAEQIATCVGLILELLSEAVQKGGRVMYNPEYADECLAPEYGGFTDTRRRGRGGARGSSGRGGNGYGGGMSDRGGDGYRRSGASNSGSTGYGRASGGMGSNYGGSGGMGSIFRGSSGMGSNYSGGGGYGGMGRGMGGNHVQTNNVSIPKSVAGAILGRGGSRMRQIQLESNTMIKMEQSDVEGDERVITIMGGPEQIQYAQYLLQQAVIQYGNMGGNRPTF